MKAGRGFTVREKLIDTALYWREVFDMKVRRGKCPPEPKYHESYTHLAVEEALDGAYPDDPMLRYYKGLSDVGTTRLFNEIERRYKPAAHRAAESEVE